MCLALGLVNTLVASGIRAAPNVPQEIMIDKTNHKFSPMSFSKKLLTQNVIMIDKIEVIQTRLVKGASKSNFLALAINAFVIPPLIQYAITDVIIIKNLIVNIQANNCTW